MERSLGAGNPADSKWNEMPLKPISKLQYSLLGVNLILEGFEAYNHILEKTVFLNNPIKILGTNELLSKIRLMGKWQGKVYEIVYDLNKKKLFQRIEIFGQKYTGWKNGAYDSRVFPRIRRS